MRLRTIITTSALAVAGGLIAVAPSASADLVTSCTGSAGAVTVPGDLIVEEGQSCTLNGTTVEGNVSVGPDSDLIVNGGTLKGAVKVGENGYFESIGGSITGGLSLRTAYGAYVESSDIGGSVNVKGMADAEVQGSVYVYDSMVGKNVESQFGEAVIDSSSIAGNTRGAKADFLDVYNSTLEGKLNVGGNEFGGVVCESEIYGNATYSGNSETLQLGADGPLASCSGASFWGGNVDVSNNMATVVFSNNIVAGNLSGTGNDPAPTGEGNRVRGETYGQFMDLAPPAAAKTTQATTDRAAQVRAHLSERGTAADAATANAGTSQL